jgi:hypothetical protein
MNAVVENVSRKVTMLDGTVMDFGVRDQIKSGFDTDSNTITFKLFSGHVVDYAPFASEHYAGCEAYPELHRRIILSGLLAKIKGNVSSLKPIEEVPVTEVTINDAGEEVSVETGEVETKYPLYDGIVAQIKVLDSGKFAVRGTSTVDEGSTLTDDEKAFALTFINHAEIFEVPQNTVGIDWTKENLDEPEIIADIQAAWAKKDRKTRGAYRTNGFFLAQLATLKIQEKVTLG